MHAHSLMPHARALVHAACTCTRSCFMHAHSLMGHACKLAYGACKRSCSWCMHARVRFESFGGEATTTFPCRQWRASAVSSGTRHSISIHQPPFLNPFYYFSYPFLLAPNRFTLSSSHSLVLLLYPLPFYPSISFHAFSHFLTGFSPQQKSNSRKSITWSAVPHALLLVSYMLTFQLVL